jgi:hypothetical protein
MYLEMTEFNLLQALYTSLPYPWYDDDRLLDYSFNYYSFYHSKHYLVEELCFVRSAEGSYNAFT